MKRKLWLIALLTVLCCAMFAVGVSAAWDGTAAGGFAGGTGTEDDPYQIATAEQLAYLAQSVNSGTTYAGQYVKLTADIVMNDTSAAMWTLSAKKWTPIGTYTDSTTNAPFSGTFDGGGHTVSGLYIQALNGTTWMSYQGLFGYAYNAALKNVTVANADITAADYVGALVGYAEYYLETGDASYTISGCTVKNSTILAEENVGGLAGRVYGYAEGSYNKKATLTLTLDLCSNSETSVTGESYVGGVAGYYQAKGYSSNYASVSSAFTNCTNSGAVSTTTTTTSSRAGGIAGYLAEDTSAKFTDCTNSGDVSASASNYSYVGGIAGYLAEDTSVTFTNCTNSGDISSSSSSSSNAGGIAGYCYSDSTFTDCTNSGTISSRTTTTTTSSSRSYVGGIAGYCYSDFTFTGCTNSGTISSHTISSYGYSYVGGIAGYCYSDFTFTGCTNNGKISVSSSSNVGGIAGQCSSSTFTGCTNNGDISCSNAGGIAGQCSSSTFTDCTNNGDISSSFNAGGIAGDCRSSTFTGCTNNGKISASSSSNAGGIAGQCSSSTFTGCTNNGKISASYAGGIVGYCDYTATFTDCTNSGMVSSGTCAGGIVAILASGSTIENCNNTGSMEAPIGTRSSVSYAGGIVGSAVKSIIRNCFNTGTFYGYQNVGGIVGYLEGGESKPEAWLYNCYNLGGVNGMKKNNSTPATYIGAVVGQVKNNVQIASCYYLGGCASDDRDNIQNGIGSADCTAPTADIPGMTVACTDAQMQQQSTFAGFDFNEIWTMAGSEVYLYPELQSVAYTGGAFTPGPLFSALPPVISAQPVSANCAQNGVAVLSVTASSPDGGVLSYQWYVSDTADGAGTEIPGAVDAVYTPSTAVGGTKYYYVTVTNTNPAATDKQTASVKSKSAAVYVLADAETPTIYAQTASMSCAAGENVALFVSSAVTDGGTLTYQWYVSNTADGAGVEISGATVSGYTPPTSVPGTKYYYVIITNVNENATGEKYTSVKSNVMAVTVGGGKFYTVSGALYTSGSADTVTIELLQGGTVVASVTVENTTGAGTYSIPGVPAGTYTMRVSKPQHVTREYEVTVGNP